MSNVVKLSRPITGTSSDDSTVWMATAELRWRTADPFNSFLMPVLQQKWRRIPEKGAEWIDEWRDVPTVTEANPEAI